MPLGKGLSTVASKGAPGVFPTLVPAELMGLFPGESAVISAGSLGEVTGTATWIEIGQD